MRPIPRLYPVAAIGVRSVGERGRLLSGLQLQGSFPCSAALSNGHISEESCSTRNTASRAAKGRKSS
jgi:hypothetical protein